MSSEEFRPLIGISADLARREVLDEPGTWRQLVQLDLRYVEAVVAAGGLPLVVPPLADPAVLRAIGERLDGLVLTGGDGLPASFEAGAASRPLPADLEPVPPERIQSELALYRDVRDRGRPVLGICLGMQLMNLEAGGTLHMDVARELEGASGHSARRGRKRHALRIAAGSALEAWYQDESVPAGVPHVPSPSVGTWHLQAVERLGKGLVAVAWSDDGVVEAIEPREGLARRWLLGVQWHPERESGPLGVELVARLVEACRAARDPGAAQS